MTKLNKLIREAILKDCIKKQFSQRQEDRKKSENSLAMDLYKNVFDEKILRAVKKIPKDWLRQDSCLRFNCGGYSLRLNVDKAVPVPYSNGCGVLGSITGDLATSAIKHAEESDKLKEEIRSAYLALETLLDSVSTIKQLSEAWPEGKQFYAGFLEAKGKSNVPALQVSELNKKLGLKETQ